MSANMWRNQSTDALMVGMENGATALLENNFAVLQMIKQGYCMTQQFHSQVYMQNI
jgi:hypothetical protein